MRTACRRSAALNVALQPVAEASVPARLAIRRLVLNGFRGYGSLRLALGPEPVVLSGPNGAGKTNLLEAVSYLSAGRGLRAAPLASVLRDAGRPDQASARLWSVAATIATPHGEVEVATGFETGTEDGGAAAERRIVRIDGQGAGGQAALARHVAMVWLTPAMDRLFVDGPSARRRFLDRLVFALDPAHAGRAQAFERSRRARARLLAEGRNDDAWLAAVEHDMAERAIAIAAARLDLIGRLQAALAEAVGPFPRPAVGLSGLVEGWLHERPALDIEERYRRQLAAMRRRDAETETCDGPHRSDLDVSFAATGRAAALCSTGEQKALLVALVLAHARLIASLKGASPILLLDEVVAHLDEARRRALYDQLLALHCQAWLSGTEPEPFHPLSGAARFLAVRDAAVTEEFHRV
ncbi:MAG: DNA replication/repair protein RecF [Alphaproteobacteria bacterium]